VSPRRLVVPLCLAILAALGAPIAHARTAPTLDGYRHFRAASIDLLGRMPTRDEIAAFEKSDFDLDAWIETQLDGPAYADRLTRVYMDLLRLEPGPAVLFAPDATTLYRHAIVGPDKKPVFVYYRARQRRSREETDGEFCLTPEETGLRIGAREQPTGDPLPVSRAVLDAHTVLVRPWWLYRDYLNVQPVRRYKAGWDNPDPAYQPVESLLTEPDGSPTAEIRICREEAQNTETGHILVTGRTPVPKGTPPPYGRKRQLPLDSAYAKVHRGEVISCRSKFASDATLDCGCGVGLEHCLPNDNDVGGSAFYFPNHLPLGIDLPIDTAKQSAGRYYPLWWSQEATHFLRYVFSTDRDFRELLTAKYTLVNGPLAQFYRAIQPGSCCNQEANFGMIEETEPLFSPKSVPPELFPHDVSDWRVVPDRGPHAAGLLTMPIFLEKFASDRARGAVLYNAFLCKSFVADGAPLTPSTEENLMVRPGCSTCHATLEPLAAYFARVEAGNLVYLPPAQFPAKNAVCKKNKNGRLSGPSCDTFYDPAFADDAAATLRGAYGSLAHADRSPVGAGADITAMPEYASCAVQRVASSFLGRPMTSDDAVLMRQLTQVFTSKGYRMRPLVRALVRSDSYRRANNLSSTVWRGGAP
jgi:hypothetical protein